MNFRKKKDVKWINLTVFIVLGIFDVIRHVYYGYQPVRLYDTLIGLSVVFLVGIYVLDGLKLWRFYVAVGIAISIAIFISTIAAGFTLALLGRDITLVQTNAIYSSIGMLSGLLLFLILYGLIKILKLEINVHAIAKGEVGFITLFLIFFGFFINDIYVLGYNQLGLSISFLALLSGIVGIYFIVYLATQKNIIKEIQWREKQQELIFYEQEQNYNRMNAKNEEIRIFRHNIQDELLYLHDLLYNGEIKKANAYITKMRGSLNTIEQGRGEDTGSKVVNASWYALMADERYKNIVATWVGKIPPQFLIDNRDMVLLFSNLLNNAFEAASQSREKYVIVKVNGKENGLFISIKNSYQGEIKKSLNYDFLTSKADKENHGIGIRIVKKIIEKYDGKVEFSHSKDEFIVLIAFNGNIYRPV